MSDVAKNTKKIIFNIRKFDPEKDKEPYYKEFTLDVFHGMTVLDGLHEIKWNQDPTLAMRYSCRMGVCGSCAMLINGKPSLACNTQILHVTKKVLCIAPLPNFDIIKDLVPDLSPMLEKHRNLHPFILREDSKEMQHPTGEYYQSHKDLLNYLQFTYCIKCGACMSACPTMATDDEYMGPMPLTQSHRYDADSRDCGFEKRKTISGSANGAFKCHYGGECSRVCPKGVDPARAIQLLKRDLVFDYLSLKCKKDKTEILGKPEGGIRKNDIPDPPPFTVK